MHNICFDYYLYSFKQLFFCHCFSLSRNPSVKTKSLNKSASSQVYKGVAIPLHYLLIILKRHPKRFIKKILCHDTKTHYNSVKKNLFTLLKRTPLKTLYKIVIKTQLKQTPQHQQLNNVFCARVQIEFWHNITAHKLNSGHLSFLNQILQKTKTINSLRKFFKAFG